MSIKIFLFVSLQLSSIFGQNDKKDLYTNNDINEPEKCDPYYNIGCRKYYQVDYPSPLGTNHKCKDYVRRDRGDQSHVYSLLKDGWQSVQRQLGSRIEPTVDGSMFKGINISGPVPAYYNFYYVNGSKPGQEFALCIFSKSGITRAKVLVKRINDIVGPRVHTRLYQVLPEMSQSERQRILEDPNIPLLKWVRNPYIRAISMYVDKVKTRVRQQGEKYYVRGLTFNNKPTFDDFIEELHRKFLSGAFLDRHFKPQYDRCWENLGLNFDYVLKIERMNYWYPCFINELNLWQYVMRGWNDAEHCYLSTPDVPCNGPIQTDDGNVVFKNSSTDGIDPAHNHDSVKLLKQFYANRTTAQLVSEIYLNDIVTYQYPFYEELLNGE
eukprot:TRINITY_DN28365_c1_g1_i1.p1 TRINITY_DN28365_c1_g1~~TRINITY_DN28365_c1_g1_i1.p1  ORF type:complete len:401 (-),score=14.40 TRINITY_DN28365_c1_g1_i1:623-1765(-)